MAHFSRLFLILLLAGAASGSSARAQSTTPASTSSPNLNSNSASQVIGPTILPEAPGTVNGGNPFQGLGRPDDTGPTRATPLQQYTPDNNTTGLFTTGGIFPSTPSVEQPGFGGQAGFSSNNASNDPSALNSALNQSSIPALNQVPGATNPGANGALQQNLNSVAQPGATTDINNKTEKSESASTEDATEAVEKLLNKFQPTHPKTTHQESAKDASQLAMALKEMHSGNLKKCLEIVDSIIKLEPKNAQAYYVKAVTNVLMHDFIQARQNYEMTLRCATDDKLTEKAKAGLIKLVR